MYNIPFPVFFVNIFKYQKRIYRNLNVSFLSYRVILQTTRSVVMQYRQAKGNHHKVYSESNPLLSAKAGPQPRAACFKSRSKSRIFGPDRTGLKCPTIDTLYKVICALEISLSEFFSFDARSGTKDTAERIQHAIATIPEEKADRFVEIVEEPVQLLHD